MAQNQDWSVKMIDRICSIDGCENRVFAREWCGSHYKKWWRWGDPNGGTAQNGAGEKFIREIAIPFTGDDCLIWPYGRSHGYGFVNRKEGENYAHRIVCEAINGAPPSPKHDAAHSCGNGHAGCVNPNHLRWDTRQGNLADMFVHGTAPIGERNGQAKLTEDDVRIIRSIGYSAKRVEIAQRFNVSAGNVTMILQRKYWRHVQ